MYSLNGNKKYTQTISVNMLPSYLHMADEATLYMSQYDVGLYDYRIKLYEKNSPYDISHFSDEEKSEENTDSNNTDNTNTEENGGNNESGEDNSGENTEDNSGENSENTEENSENTEIPGNNENTESSEDNNESGNTNPTETTEENNSSTDSTDTTNSTDTSNTTDENNQESENGSGNEPSEESGEQSGDESGNGSEENPEESPKEDSEDKVTTPIYVFIQGYKPDGKIFRYKCDYSGCYVYLPNQEQITNVDGVVKCEIVIIKEKMRKTSEVFFIHVEKSLIQDAYKVSKDEVVKLPNDEEAEYNEPSNSEDTGEIADNSGGTEDSGDTPGETSGN